jgi:hypothetical protein
MLSLRAKTLRFASIEPVERVHCRFCAAHQGRLVFAVCAARKAVLPLRRSRSGG